MGGILLFETLVYKTQFYVYIGSYILGITFLVFSVIYPRGNISIANIFIFAGKSCTKWIYVFHYAIILFLNHLRVKSNYIFFIVVGCSFAYIVFAYKIDCHYKK